MGVLVSREGGGRTVDETVSGFVASEMGNSEGLLVLGLVVWVGGGSYTMAVTFS